MEAKKAKVDEEKKSYECFEFTLGSAEGVHKKELD
jgi:hypothetical protein